MEEKTLIVYSHIGATGGASLVEMMSNRYQDCFCRTGGLELYSDRCMNLAIQNHFANKATCIINKMGFNNKHLEAIQCDKKLYLTMLREPAKHLLSLYFWQYCNLHGIASYFLRKDEMVSFLQFCVKMDNYQIRSILNVWDRAITFEDYKEARQRLEREYLIVGLTEKYDESLYMMYKQLNFSKRPYYYYAAGVKSSMPKEMIQQTEENIEYVKECSSFDNELYNHFKNRLENSLNALSSAEKDEMKLYIHNQNKVSDGTITIAQLDCLEDLKNKRIYIFGSGQYELEVYDFFKQYLTVKGFIAETDSKHNIKGITGKTLSESSFNEDDYIVIASLNHNEIKQKLLSRGITEDQIIFPEILVKEGLRLIPKGIIENDKRRNAVYHATVDDMIPAIRNLYQKELEIVISNRRIVNHITLSLYACGEQLQFFLDALAETSKIYKVNSLFYRWQNELNAEYEWRIFLNKLSACPQSTLYIFGTGQGGQTVYNILHNSPAIQELEIKLNGFLDNDQTKHHVIFNGVPILAPSCIIGTDAYCIIASASYYEEIKKQLLQLGISEEKIIYFDYILQNAMANTENGQSIWELTLKECKDSIIKKYGSIFKDYIKRFTLINGIKKIVIDIVDFEDQEILQQLGNEVAAEFPDVKIYLSSKKTTDKMIDFYVVGNLIADSNKIIDDLLDNGISTDKILQLW